MKKALSLLLSLLMVFTVFSVAAPTAFAAGENPSQMKSLNPAQAFKPYREIITSVSFTDSLDAAPSEGYVWDVSVDADGSVKAWLTDVVTTEKDGVTTTKSAKLVIGAEGKVKLPVDSGSFFENFTSLKEVDFNSSVDASTAKKMNNMFRGCLSLDGLNTENVTEMCGMFYGCENLTELDIDELNTASVTDMSLIFYGLKKLQTLDLSNFNTANVINMNSMFEKCSAITTLDLGSFNTEKVLYMSQMFFECINLVSVELSSFDTSSVITMEKMFDSCLSLESVSLSNFETEKVQFFNEMFENCISLETLDLSHIEINGAYSIAAMMRGCSELREVRINNWFFGDQLTDMSGLFNGCESLTDIYIYDVGYSGESKPDQDKAYHGVQTTLLRFHDNRNIGTESELYKRFFDDAYGAQLVFDLLEPYEIRFTPNELNLIEGQFVTVETSIYPRLERYELIWESENPDIATVKNGVVTAVGVIEKGEGENKEIINETYIKVSIKGIECKEAKIKVTVDKADPDDYYQVTFKKPDSIEYFHVSKNGGETYIPVYDNGTFEYLKGTSLIVKAQGNAIAYVFSIDGKEVETEDSNRLVVKVNHKMTIGVRAINPPSGEEALSFFDRIINWFRDLFQKLFGWMN